MATARNVARQPVIALGPDLYQHPATLFDRSCSSAQNMQFQWLMLVQAAGAGSPVTATT
jgi:hypothetical protein